MDLVATDPAAPDGYAVSAEVRGPVVCGRVVDSGGELAAQGQPALFGTSRSWPGW